MNIIITALEKALEEMLVQTKKDVLNDTEISEEMRTKLLLEIQERRTEFETHRDAHKAAQEPVKEPTREELLEIENQELKEKLHHADKLACSLSDSNKQLLDKQVELENEVVALKEKLKEAYGQFSKYRTENHELRTRIVNIKNALKEM